MSKRPTQQSGSPGRLLRARSPIALLAAACLLAAVAWWLFTRDTYRPPLRRNVLLVTIDTLRADALGAYGNSLAATPVMDRLAAGGIRFRSARAHSVLTLPAHANILTGRLPPEHGVRDNAGFRLAAGEATLATRLKERGFHTGAFVSGFPLDSRFGLSRGFDVYDDAFVDATARPTFLEQERAGTETVAAALRWLKDRRASAEPWFAWIHLYEPHYPYASPEPFASRFARDPYAGEVAATDAALAPLLQPIVAAGKTTDTLVIVTADHGESLGDHGEATHGIFAYEATLRVPLIVFSPPLIAPAVVDEPASHIDILPTILDALGMPAAEGLRGHSLLRASTGSDAAGFLYFEALGGWLNRGWAPLSGVVADGIKYIDLPIPELYDLRSDPQESNNLSAGRPQQVAAYRTLLESIANRDIRRGDETAEVKERLRALGYVSSTPRPPKVFAEADDPKRQIAVETTLQDIVRLSLDSRGSEALERARALASEHPDMKVALLHLAQLERDAGRLPEAVAALQRALAIQPGDADTAALLAGYLSTGNKPREAVALLRPYAIAGDADVQVLTTLALAEARSGQPDEALRTLERARAQDPSNATIPITKGTVELMAGRRAEARASFEAALALNGSIARAYSSLAALAADEGRLEESLQHWRRAVALDPAEFEKLLAIGLSFARAGRTAEARPYVQLFADGAPGARYAADVAKARLWLRGERQ